jgi:hypothetical protein
MKTGSIAKIGRAATSMSIYLDLYIASRHSRPKFGSLTLSVKKLRALPLPLK